MAEFLGISEVAVRYWGLPRGIGHGRSYQIWAVTCDYQQCGILTSVDSDEPVHPTVKLNNTKWSLVSRWTVLEYLRDLQWLWSDCAYAQAGLSLCWSHIPHCWKSQVTAHMQKRIWVLIWTRNMGLFYPSNKDFLIKCVHNVSGKAIFLICLVPILVKGYYYNGIICS